MNTTELPYIKSFGVFTLANVLAGCVIGAVTGFLAVESYFQSGTAPEEVGRIANLALWLAWFPASYFVFKWSIQRFIVGGSSGNACGGSPNKRL